MDNLLLLLAEGLVLVPELWPAVRADGLGPAKLMEPTLEDIDNGRCCCRSKDLDYGI
jgi:hypothetical protein